MGEQLRQNNKRTVLAVVLSALFLLLICPIVVVMANLPKIYPNASRLDNQTETDIGSHTRTVIFRSQYRTTDSREIVTDWYGENNLYDFSISNEGFDGLERMYYQKIPALGEVDIRDTVLIFSCSSDRATCITHASRFHIEFDGFLGEGIEKILNRP